MAWSPPRARVDGLDVVAIGAINLDHIATTSQVAKVDPRHVQDLLSRFEMGEEEENVATDDEVRDAIERLDPRLNGGLLRRLGGSSLNAATALADLDLGLKIGFVGVLGRIHHSSLNVDRHMQRFDTTCLAKDPFLTSGLSMAFMFNGDRRLKTSVGANGGLARHLTERREEIAAYLASARVVHVTSLLDTPSQHALAELLERLIVLAPETIIVLDPGSVWARRSSESSIARVLACADCVLLNEMEFHALGDAQPGDRDTEIAHRVFTRCSSSAAVIVIKHIGGSTVFHRRESALPKEVTFSHRALRASDIEDSTGAGDLFAAGVLAALASWRHQTEAGAYLGATLARSKLLGRADAHHLKQARYSAIGWIEETDASLPDSRRQDVRTRERVRGSPATYSRTLRWPRWAGQLESFLGMVQEIGIGDVEPIEVTCRWPDRSVTKDLASVYDGLRPREILGITSISLIVGPVEEFSIRVTGDVADGLVVEIQGCESATVNATAGQLKEYLELEAKGLRAPLGSRNARGPLMLMSRLLARLTPALELLPPGVAPKLSRFIGPINILVAISFILAVAGFIVKWLDR